MWPYCVLIILPIVIQHIKIGNISHVNPTLSEIRYRRKSEFSMKLFWGMLLILLMLRHKTTGIDIYTYEYIFDYIAKSDWLIALGRSSEVAWSFLNKLVAELGGGFRTVLVITSFASTFWVSKAYVKYSDDTSLTISLFIMMSNFVLLFSGLRQAISISLGFLAFEFVKSKKIVPFTVVTIVAILFHTSAFMLAFMYPLYYVKLKKKWLIFIIPSFIVIWIFNQQIFSILGFILKQFTDYDTTVSKTGSVTMLILFVIFAAFSYLIPDESKMDADTAGMRNFLLLALAIQTFAPLHPVAMRMNYYYIVFIPLLIPRIIRHRSVGWAQVALAARHLMIVFFIVYFFIKVPSDNVLQTFPYRFFWESVGY